MKEMKDFSGHVRSKNYRVGVFNGSTCALRLQEVRGNVAKKTPRARDMLRVRSDKTSGCQFF